MKQNFSMPSYFIQKFYFLFFIFYLIISNSFTGSVYAEETEILYLSGKDKDHTIEWEFYCTGGRNSGKWTTIPVPSCWELQGFGTYNYGHDLNPADEQGKYRYRFKIPASWKDKHIEVVFEGSMTDTDVWINGKKAGPTHRGAFYEFKYDITHLVKIGQENLLEVTVSKRSSVLAVSFGQSISRHIPGNI